MKNKEEYRLIKSSISSTLTKNISLLNKNFLVKAFNAKRISSNLKKENLALLDEKGIYISNVATHHSSIIYETSRGLMSFSFSFPSKEIYLNVDDIEAHINVAITHYRDRTLKAVTTSILAMDDFLLRIQFCTLISPSIFKEALIGVHIMSRYCCFIEMFDHVFSEKVTKHEIKQAIELFTLSVSDIDEISNHLIGYKQKTKEINVILKQNKINDKILKKRENSQKNQDPRIVEKMKQIRQLQMEIADIKTKQHKHLMPVSANHLIEQKNALLLAHSTQRKKYLIDNNIFNHHKLLFNIDRLMFIDTMNISL